MAMIRIKAQNVPPLKAGHPWVFAQAIERIEGDPATGEVVDVVDPSGRFIGRGFYSKGSSIPIRLLTTNPDVTVDNALLRARLRQAQRLRRDLGLPSAETTGYRLVNAEGDGLAGLTVDVFGQALVVRFHTIGMAQRADAICNILSDLLKPRAIYEAKGDRNQAREGLVPSGGLLRGLGEELWTFHENGLLLTAELPGGQKTGFFFDQRENRARVSEVAAGRRVLDLYCYTGAFSLNAGKAGASEVVGVDSSAIALLAADEHAARNKLKGTVKFLRSDVRKMLGELQRTQGGSLGLGDSYDLVILDPPKLMTSQNSRDQARKAYRWINAAALRVLNPGGLLASCCCSGRMSTAEFLRIIGYAARDARRPAMVLEVRGAGPDHPFPPAFDPGRYLKFVLLKVES